MMKPIRNQLIALLALLAPAQLFAIPAWSRSESTSKSNLATLVIWGVWWPAMVWFAVLFGRVWCTVCPLEMVASVSGKVAGWVGFQPRPLARWLSSGAIIVTLYASIQILVAGAHINRVPAYTAFFLIGLFGVATVAGVAFRDRAFCRGFCPVGVLLNVYGRGAMLAVRPGEGPAARGPAIDARTCPSLLNPSRLASNAHCLVCGACLKAAAPGKMRFLLRRPFPTTDTRDAAAPWPITIFVMLVSGFVIAELFTEWPAAERFFLAAPIWTAAKLDASASVGWFKAAWILGIVPLVLWSVLGGLQWLSGSRRRLGALWRELALPMAILVSAGHMSKGLAKFVAWAPFLPGALRDSSGSVTAQSIAAAPATAPAPLLSIVTVAIVSEVLIATAFCFAVREHRLAQPTRTPRASATLPLAIVALGFLAIVGGWAYR